MMVFKAASYALPSFYQNDNNNGFTNLINK